MPRGRGRPVRASRPVNTANQPNNVQTRGRKRQAEEDGDSLAEDTSLQSNAGSSNFIDFEQIMRASQLLPNSNVSINNNSGSNDLSMGCGSGSVNNNSSPLVTRGNPPQRDFFQSNAMRDNSACVPMPVTRLADDDIAAHLPSSIKQQICRGEYVNLALMLKGTVELSQYCDGSIFKLSLNGEIEACRRDCKEKIFDIEKWTNAFLIYASVYLSNHADKSYELIHYMYNIREAAARQGSYCWREYDEQFRLRQAITPAPWSKINNDLWWRCMQLKPVNKNPSNVRRYTCNPFNSGSCTWPDCKFSHTCSKCHGPHPEIKCTWSGPQSNTQSSNTQSNFNNKSFRRPKGSFNQQRKN